MFKPILQLAIALLAFSTIAGAQTQAQSSDAPITLNRLKINLGDQIMTQIEADPVYQAAFKKIYGEKVSPKNIIDSITQYERSLTSSSRFDDYQHGNKTALTPEEIRGYQLFNSYGCGVCHSGENLGGTQFKQLGVARNYLIERKTLLTPADFGLSEVTKNTKDFYVFRVPSMRNVAITQPYYHDGSVKSLNEAVYLMGKYQLGVEIPDKDIKSIVMFLNTLTAKSLEHQNLHTPVQHEDKKG
jgi:cytochrome c peroxidase